MESPARNSGNTNVTLRGLAIALPLIALLGYIGIVGVRWCIANGIDDVVCRQFGPIVIIVAIAFVFVLAPLAVLSFITRRRVARQKQHTSQMLAGLEKMLEELKRADGDPTLDSHNDVRKKAIEDVEQLIVTAKSLIESPSRK